MQQAKKWATLSSTFSFSEFGETDLAEVSSLFLNTNAYVASCSSAWALPACLTSSVTPSSYPAPDQTSISILVRHTKLDGDD